MSAVPAREHHWDSLRAFLMLLGIPYHAAMVYNMRVLWDIHSPDKSEFLTFLSGVLVTFRMPAFFMVAGYFAAMLLERRTAGSWLRGRFLRLGIPLLTGLALLAPLQIALIDLSDALTRTASMQSALARVASDITHPGFSWIMHLWFLPALLAYSVILVVGLQWLRQTSLAGRLQQLRRHLVTHPRAGLALLTLAMTAWEVAIHLSRQAMLALDGSLPYLFAHGIDPYLRYLPFFLLGVALRSAPDIRLSFVWQKGWELPVLAATTAVLAALLRGRSSAQVEILYNAMDGAAAILASLVMIGIAQRFWNRPDPRIDRIVDASFSIYLLHHPIIFGLAAAFLAIAWPPVIEFALICLLTFLLSYAAHRLIRRSSLALFLFNGVPMPRRPRGDGRPERRITTLR